MAADMTTLADAAYKAGFTGQQQLATMIAIAMAESGGRFDINNAGTNRNGTVDYGAWQINSVHRPDLDRVYDPYYNAQQAWRVHTDLGQGYGAWSAYNAGKHTQFMAEAAEAARKYLESGPAAGSAVGAVARGKGVLAPKQTGRDVAQTVLSAMSETVSQRARERMRDRLGDDEDGLRYAMGMSSLDDANLLLQGRAERFKKPPAASGLGEAPDAAGHDHDHSDVQGVSRPAGQNGRLDPDLLVDADGRGNLMQPAAASAWQRMVEAASGDGIVLAIGNSYRDIATQERLAQELGLYSQGGLAAQPGHSNHGWGLAVDIVRSPEVERWLRNNADRYGFSTIPREPWHWEFKG